MNDEIVFYPAKYKNTYRNWLENIKDWCISRQLWWGHRIPAYYDADLLAQTGLENYPDDKIIVSETKPEGNYVQDEGALDTWFSSWLWPISLFIEKDQQMKDSTWKNKELEYYYPTADLVTGPDIIFFWVARMIMAGYEYQGKMPFKHVYFTGIVRDKLGRKMSKSLGNSPDPLDLIERYGADGVRMGILLSAPAGNDILYDDSLCEQGRNFCNKIWNCFRMMKGLEVADIPQPETNKYAIQWFEAKLGETSANIADLFSKYRLSEALMEIYKLYCDEFSGWYLEMIKPAYQLPIDRATYEATMAFFDRLLVLLHPFMPFITEELWQNLCERKPGESIMVAPLNNAKACRSIEGLSEECRANVESILSNTETLKEIIAGVRNIRASKNIPQKECLTLYFNSADRYECAELLKKLANVELADSELLSTLNAQLSTFIVGTTEFAIPMDAFINVDEEIKKLEADLQHQQGFLRGVQAKLSNERFVQNAKPEIVELERKKEHDALARIATIQESLAKLKK